jgi:hypothetical protein
MAEERSAYLSYLLRLWRVDEVGEPASGPAAEPSLAAIAWRASLESAHSSERWFFASPEELYAFLSQQMGFEKR